MNSDITYKNSKTLKRLLLFAIFASVTIIVIVFIRYRNNNPEDAAQLSATEGNVTMRLENVDHSATSDGVRKWHMNAESASLEDEGRQMVLKNPSVVFFIENGEDIHLTADKGVLMTTTNNIDVSGNVKLKRSTFSLATEELKYRYEKGILFTEVPVFIQGDEFDLRADSLLYDINNNLTSFEGNVEGKLRDRISL